MAVIGWALPLSESGPERAQVALETIDGGKERTVSATIRLDPRDSVDDPEWMNVTAWQGGGSVVDPLEKVGEGVYRTTKPIPVYGSWKSTLRIQQGDALDLDAALHAEGRGDPREGGSRGGELHARVPARHRGAPARAEAGRLRALTLMAYLTVLAIALALIALISWSLLRVDRGEGALAPRAAGPGARAPNSCETALKEVGDARRNIW